jgi:DNA-binding LacI/PurR family transcriptional regulator
VTRLAAVAKYAGVSEATVSRVLNGKPGVAQVTRESVLTALDVFGFVRPQQLRREGGRLIGLVLPDLQNPIFPAFAEVIGVSLIQRGLVPVLCTRTSDSVSEANYIEMLLAQRVGGIIFVGSSYADAGAEQGRQLTARKLPIVLVNAADENLGVPRVSVDDAGAARQAFEHLAGLGHRNIGLILGPTGHLPSVRKLAGFVEFCQARGVPAETGLVDHTAFTVEGGRGAANRLIAAGATALVCASDALALGAIRAARRLGHDVPRDISVIGFDDSMFMAVTDPPLTTLRQPVRAIAAAAVTSLMSQLNGAVVNRNEVSFEAELVVRGTIGPCRLRPEVA